jgi:DNA-binding transcriptional ArsR family regulator
MSATMTEPVLPLPVAVFHALGHPFRWQILRLCANGDEVSATSIKDLLEVRLSVVSYHAGLLVDAQVLRQRVERRSSYYRLDADSLPETARYLGELFDLDGPARGAATALRARAVADPITW